MRASRLVSVLLLLQARGGLTASQIAAELEVSVRTVHRDVEALAAAGVPIYADRGPHGGIRLVEGYRTRLTGLTEDEAKAVFLSGLPGPAAELGLGTVVAAARLKVLAALPPELRSRASRLGQRFHLDAPGWFSRAETNPCLADVATAVWEDRQLRIRYDRGDRVVDREIDPLGLVLKGGVWYAVARTEGGIRTYRISRILEATVHDTRFERDPDFDLASHWSENTAAYEQAAEKVTVTLRVDPKATVLVHDVLGPAVAETAELLADYDPAGWQRLQVTLPWPTEVPRRLLGLGAAAEVIAPDHIRTAVAAEARAVVDAYPGRPLEDAAAP
jgi:predicted DNA-binding transcriptional regulator YafY